MALDACPGILALHPARDGLVARVRLPGGYASRPRWRALARLARDFGDGYVDITARGNVQLRGLRAADAAALAARAARAGLLPSRAHDRARNITASPLAGLAGRPPLRALVDALDRRCWPARTSPACPGRFLFALDDGTGGAGLAVCDLGLRAGAARPPPGFAPRELAATGFTARASRRRSFDLVVAGRETGARVPAARAVAAVLAAAQTAPGPASAPASPASPACPTAARPSPPRSAAPWAPRPPRTPGCCPARSFPPPPSRPEPPPSWSRRGWGG